MTLIDLKEMGITNVQSFKIWKNEMYVLKTKDAIKIIRGITLDEDKPRELASYALLQQKRNGDYYSAMPQFGHEEDTIFAINGLTELVKLKFVGER